MCPSLVCVSQVCWFPGVQQCEEAVRNSSIQNGRRARQVLDASTDGLPDDLPDPCAIAGTESVADFRANRGADIHADRCAKHSAHTKAVARADTDSFRESESRAVAGADPGPVGVADTPSVGGANPGSVHAPDPCPFVRANQKSN